MIYRKLDENGDYTFGGNANSFVSDAQAVKQAVITRLRLLLYEWWENLEDGLPLFQKILANRDVERADSLIKERIQGTQNVKNILNYQSSWDNEHRVLSISCVLNTVFGVVVLDEEVM